MQFARPLVPDTEGASSDALISIAKLGRSVDAMRERTELLEAVVENFPGGIALFDRSMRMVLCNQKLVDMLDYPASLFASGQPTMEALFRFNASRGEYGLGDPEAQVALRVARLLDPCAHVYERTRPNGTVMEVRGVPLATGGFVTTYFDVTEQRRAQAMIAHMAHHDSLTDLANRALFTERLQTALASASLDRIVAVHCLDLDGFKRVNDTLGHACGDQVLRRVAEQLKTCVGPNDTVARLGGDEFAIVQVGVSGTDAAETLAANVIAAVRTVSPAGRCDLPVGTSIGIAFAPHNRFTVDELLRQADAALYRSKRAGRGRYVVHRSRTPD